MVRVNARLGTHLVVGSERRGAERGGEGPRGTSARVNFGPGRGHSPGGRDPSGEEWGGVSAGSRPGVALTWRW